MFNIGDRVCLAVDQNRIGIIVAVQQNPATENLYRVFHDAAHTGEYFEGQLRAANNAIAERVSFSELIDEYAQRKLSMDSEDTLFSLNTGKIEFVPFQFRPLLRILHAERPRMLIADEVGVGKTIETGIILKEYEKRERVDSVLVICPKDLTLKWRLEMKTKFNEAFEVLSSDRLNYCLRELEEEGVWPYECRKCVIGLELLRREENLERLDAMEDAARFDMLIVDEAHHAVNPASNSHRAVEYFCGNAEIVVFLSATPLQLGAGDLYSLLKLLLPEEFPDEAVFTAMAQPNAYINAAIHALRDPQDGSWREAAADALSMTRKSGWAAGAFRENRLLNRWIGRLTDGPALSDEERLACLKDVESLHTFAHVINRTKRKDIGTFTIREPVTVKTRFDPEEQAFYNAATSFKFTALCRRYGERTAAFLMSTIERQITSSLPAFVSLLDGFVRRGLLQFVELSDDPEDEDCAGVRLDPAELKAWAAELKHLAEKLPKTDAKANELLQIIDHTVREKPGKLLVFSFFKHTLRYLFNIIAEQGHRVELITGETPMELRTEYRNRFRLPTENKDAIDVLLCSEVGCEGLDYEFCSRLVNYDIPWNPMKIEQRIGRIDRFGQKSQKVQIYNFITEGTVEERVFYRCFERLGVFQSTIGDLEGVLGEMTDALNAAAFDLSLTEAQQRQKAQQIADNAIRLAEEKHIVEKASQDLLMLDVNTNDQQLSDEKTLQICWQMQLVRSYFSREYPGAGLEPITSSRMKLRMLRDEKKQLLSRLDRMKQRRRLDRNDQNLAELEAYLYSNEQTILLNFDPAVTEVRNKCLQVSATHPFVKLALTDAERKRSKLTVSCRTSDRRYLSAGEYLFVCMEWKKLGYKASSELKAVLMDLKDGRQVSIRQDDFERLLLSAEECPQFREPNTAALDNSIYETLQAEKRKLAETNEDIVARKLSTLNSFYSKLIGQTKRTLESTENEKIRVMQQARLRRLTAALESRSASLTEKRCSDILTDSFAYGTIEVL